MNYALQTPKGQHLGFLVMAADDDDATTGLCLFRAQSSSPEDSHLAEYQTLVETAARSSLYWRFSPGQARADILTTDDVCIGHLKDEWLFLGSHQYQLVDLVGIL
ncbi:MAG: hypothetical protein KA214_07905 [Neisseriaceae bacterium]|nr:hypothetical protein [Neisseriaceae bacterium]